MARRRPLRGQSLLVASTALTLGCPTVEPFEGGAVSGNLVAPPMYELCITAEPSTAAVTIDQNALEADGCSQVYEGEHVVAATAEGYTPHEETVTVTGNTQLTVVLVASTP